MQAYLISRDQIFNILTMTFGDMYEESERRDRRRCRSVSSSIPSRVREKRHSLGESFHRNISQTSRIKHLPSKIPQYLATVISPRLVPRSEEGYDSDEEDRKNGVPIIVTGNKGYKVSSTTIRNARLQLEEKFEQKSQLQRLLAIPESRYLEARLRFFKNHGMDWDAEMWSYFITLEDEYFQINDQIFEAECEIDNLETKLSSLENRNLLPSGHWNIERDGTRTWIIDDNNKGGGASRRLSRRWF
ncbi:hypothetical protein F5B19DRAFT_467428 [Rostrohypoxylon terebratum]|nr:hypothetical protein F5B19DRAFT_467428 [Rostrohypoxylon terebratum]